MSEGSSTILVTGALGTLGQPLVGELRVRGKDVVPVDLSHSSAGNYRRADVRDYRQLEKVFEEVRPGVVYHLAAEFGRHNGNEFYEQCWTTNMLGTANMIDLCARFDAQLIFASSSEIYGELDHDAEGGQYISELADELPLRPTNDYAISKWANELQVMNAEQDLGLEAMRLRFFNAYGPGEEYHPYRSVVCLFVNKLMRGEKITVFDGYHRTFMYIGDFIPTLANAADKFVPGEVVNIGGRDYRSVNELAECVVEHLNDSGYPVLGDELISHQSEDAHNIKDKRPDITKAEELLGHDPTVTLEEGVPAYIDWLKRGVPVV